MKDDLRVLKASGLTYSRYQGEILFIESGMVVGWAIDIERPDYDLAVELGIDGVSEKLSFCSLPLGPFVKDSTLAKSVAKRHAIAPKTIAEHGFAMALSPDEQREAQRLELRVANTGRVLGAPITLHLPKRFRFTGGLLGEVFSDLQGRLWGWALDPRQMQPLHLELQEEGLCLDSQWAGQYVPDLVKHGLGRGFFGFSLQAPDHCFDGNLHRFFVVDEEGRRVPGSPIEMTLAPQSTRRLIDEIKGAVADRPQAMEALNTLGALLKQSERVLHADDEMFRLRHDCLLPSTQLLARFGNSLKGQTPPLISNLEMRLGLLILTPSPEKKAKKSRVKVIEGTTPLEFLSPSAAASLQTTEVVTLSENPTEKELRHWLKTIDRLDAVVMVRADIKLAPWALALLAKPIGEGALVSFCDGLIGKEPLLKPAWDPFLQRQVDAIDLSGPMGFSVKALSLLCKEALDSNDCPTPRDFFWMLALKAEQDARQPKGQESKERFFKPAAVGLPYVGYARQPEAREKQAVGSETFYQMAFNGLCEQDLENLNHRAKASGAQGLSTDHKVSLIIAMRDKAAMTERCIRSCLKQSGLNADSIEIIVVDNQSQEPESHRLLQQLKSEGVQVIAFDEPFNFARIMNMAVKEAKGQFIALLNNDIEANLASSKNWLSRLITALQWPTVKAVGCKLAYDNGMVQHAGVLFTQDGCPDHMGIGLHINDEGYLERNQRISQVPSVTAACMVLRRDDFLKAGGMDEQRFAIAFNDVDLCLKLGQTGRVLVANNVALTHHESKSRGSDRESTQKRLRLARELRAIQQVHSDCQA